MIKTKVKFIIDCPQCKKENRGKPISLGYVKQCNCGHAFTKDEIEKGLEKVRELRNIEKQNTK